MRTQDGVVGIVPGKNDQGEHIFGVVVKRSYRIKHQRILERCPVDRELRRIDAYYDDGDPEWATVRDESELAPFKPATDVVVVGRAYAPRGELTDQMTVSVQVGPRTKRIAVIGDRHCEFRQNQAPGFSEPIPFTRMEIRYEKAYGGRDETSNPGVPFFYPRNHMGTGIALRNTRETIHKLALPNLEDPGDLLTPERLILDEPERWSNQPLPQGFGWFQRTWYPRTTFAGLYPPYLDVDTVTPEERLEMVPKNHIALAKQFRLPSYRPRFNNGASQGMIFSSIRSDEKITLHGLNAEGFLEFTLPGEMPKIGVDIGSGFQQLSPRLDTVTIYPDDLEAHLIWRGACLYEGYAWLPKMKKLEAIVE